MLEKLNIIHQEFYEGKRAAPAFSQVTADQLNRADEEAWKNITIDLKDAGIDTGSISSARPFIRNWIDNVILEDTLDDECEMVPSDPPGRHSGNQRHFVDGDGTTVGGPRLVLEQRSRHRSTSTHFTAS